MSSEYLQTIISWFTSTRAAVITIFGLNHIMNWGEKSILSTHKGRKYQKALFSLSICVLQYNSGKKETAVSCIDHIYCNAKYRISEVKILSFGASDHDVIMYTRYSKEPVTPTRTIWKRSYKNFDFSNIYSLPTVQRCNKHIYYNHQFSIKKLLAKPPSSSQRKKHRRAEEKAQKGKEIMRWTLVQ